MHDIPEFSKRSLSVSKLVDDGYKVHFLQKHVIIKDKTGKKIKCSRDLKSELYYLPAKEEETCQAVMDSKSSKWKNVVGDMATTTRIDKTKMVTAKMPKTVEINDAHDVCGHTAEALL
jgi:hypothetical protein